MKKMIPGQPRLTIVAGVPGSGIQPWLAANRERLLPKRFYDPDVIANGIGDWDNTETRQRATSIMNEMIAKDIRLRRCFGFKTSYANGTTTAVVRRLATDLRLAPNDDDDPSLTDCANYIVHAYFIGTKAPTVNQKRLHETVIKRREPYRRPEQIERQWTSSLENMRKTIRLLDQVTLISGTSDLVTVAVARPGNVEQHAKRLPAWAKRILDGLTPPKTTYAKPQDNLQANA